MEHEHKWVQLSIAMWPGPLRERPTIGATVTWRCTRRGCWALREQKYNFRKPTTKQGPNVFGRPITVNDVGNELALFSNN